MNDQSIHELFLPLWADLAEKETFEAKSPLLAHYTSIGNLEKILSSNEIWFSNPLLMNDLEEVRFSINEGRQLALESDLIENACKTKARVKIFDEHFELCYSEFANEHALDTMVFCFSEHDNEDQDGLLSMWRGYGGNGAGAAIVLDTSKLEHVDTSTLILAKVDYGTTNERVEWIERLIATFAGILADKAIPDDSLYIAASALFERLKMFALFSKHRGFAEEREWRVVYLPDQDTEKKLTPMLDYSIGAHGVEPKLKFKIGPIDGITGSKLSLETLVDRILLGPSISSPLAKAAFLKMLDRLGKHDLKARVYASAIPFRPV